MEIFHASFKGQNLGNVTGRRFVKADLSDCIIGPCRGAQFIHSKLWNAKFVSTDVMDYIGMGTTWNCSVFENVELPPIAFDALIKLLTITNCDPVKREGLRRLIDPNRLAFLDRSFPSLE